MKNILLNLAALSLLTAATPGSLFAEEPAGEKPASPEVGQPFPDFAEMDLDGKPASIANYKGKVVLVDFWATWCGPCVAELPNVRKVYDAYHEKGFEVIGISLDQKKDKLTNFVAAKKIPWPQVFDEKSKLARRYNIQFIPATYLIDKEGKVIAAGLRGAALDTAVAKALETK